MGLKYGSRRDSNEEKDKQTLLETTWKIQVYSNVSKQRKRKKKKEKEKEKVHRSHLHLRHAPPDFPDAEHDNVPLIS